MWAEITFKFLFYRNLEVPLQAWAREAKPKPLLIRGARQVGKTTLVEKIRPFFDHFIGLNLEKSQDRFYFENTDQVRIIFESLLIRNRLEVAKGQAILLFLDEIQQFPKAIGLLRYFYEELPDVHVVAAGSLLEFALADVPSMPVGRIEQMVLHPMSFDEFLLATNQKSLYAKWQQLDFDPHWHGLFMDQFRKYLVVGGMPAAIRQYLEDGESTVHLGKIFDNIWLSYQEDVLKYRRNATNQKVLQYIMEHVPFELNRFSFAAFGQNLYKSREISEAFGQLEKAKILSLVYPTTALKPPLVPNYKKRPRIQFLDTGMLLYLNQQQTQVLLGATLQEQFKGGILNHVVWQEIKALSHSPLSRYVFWVREEGDANSEIDLMLSLGENLLPVEVKAGASGRLRSLFEFMDRTETRLAVRVLDNQFSTETLQTIKGKTFQLVNLPLYAVGKIREVLAKPEIIQPKPNEPFQPAARG